MASCHSPAGGLTRRTAFKVGMGAAAGAALALRPQKADAQTLGDIDLLNLVLNLEYLLVQFVRTAAAQVIDVARLTGNGVAGTPPLPGRAVTFIDRNLQTIVTEIGNDNYGHLVPIRVVIGAASARQPLIDISAGATAPFSVAMQRAGVVAPGAAFDAYASEENFLYALFLLKSISVAAYRGLTSAISNRVVVQNFTGILGTEAIHAATVRGFLYERGATIPRLRENAGRIAAYLGTLNGGQAFQGISPSTRTPIGGGTPVTVANITPVQANGEVAGRSAAQVLNLLYLTSTASSAGGFFPEGVTGTIRTSAGA